MIAMLLLFSCIMCNIFIPIVLFGFSFSSKNTKANCTANQNKRTYLFRKDHSRFQIPDSIETLGNQSFPRE